MKKSLSRIVLGVATGSALVGSAFAVDEPIDVYATFRAGVSLNQTVEMDFTPGSTFIDYLGGAVSGTDFARLATNGTVDFVGTQLLGNTSGNAALVAISGDGASTVNISCTPNAIIANSGGARLIEVSALQISVSSGKAWGSADDQCAGLGTSPLALTLNGVGTNDRVYVGGRITGATADFSNESFDTTQTNGVPAQLRVVYQ